MVLEKDRGFGFFDTGVVTATGLYLEVCSVASRSTAMG